MFTALVLAASAKLASPLLTFNREPSFDPRHVTIEVGVLKTGATSEFWFRQTVRRGKAKATWWTDTVRCPAARLTLNEVRNLEMPRVFVAVLENDQIIITADGVLYRLSGKAEYPGATAYDFEIQSNNGTPLARWVDESLRRLHPCWSKDRPKAR